MKIKSTLNLFVFLLGIIQLSFAQQKSPNIILIVADDLGYSDLGCYGGEINTPALNKMASEGLQLSNMHNAAMCVVSRSSMLTGKWWPRTGAGIKSGNNIAQILKENGYRTGLIGKWHLDGHPNDKGFDFFFGFLNGFASYYKGNTEYRLNKVPFKDFGKDFYSTDEFTKRAIDFIKPKENKPFFLYLSYQAPHNPLQAPKEDIMKYRGKYLKGWQAIREARIKNQIKLGIIEPGTPLPDYPQNLPDWESLSSTQKDLEDLRMAVYAAMVERMDQGIEKLTAALKENGQNENTFIFFLSDNGTDSFSRADPEMIKRGLLPGDDGSNYQPGTGWAWATVSPFRLYKISQHSGGVKTGAIAWYPKLIKTPGAIKTQNMHVVDIVSTIMDMAMPIDKAIEKSKINAELAGKSFYSLLQGENWERESPMYFQYLDNRAIRTKKWSLIEVDGSGWELYNSQKDPLETDDLAKDFPKMVKKLSEQWMKWWKTEGNTTVYNPERSGEGPHYRPQGDRGTGDRYEPSAMPANQANRYPIPKS